MERSGQVINCGQSLQLLDEPDCLCMPVCGSLSPCAEDPRYNAQLLLSMKQTDGTPCPIEPRAILQRILEKCHQRGIYPVVAAEIEFYLTGTNDDVSSGGSFNHDVSLQHKHILDELEKQCSEQKLPVTGIVAEAEDGQFELNLSHSDKVISVCENIVSLKRLTHQLAKKQGLRANFMAKPFSVRAVSGMHFHVSLNDKQGINLLASPEGIPNIMLRRSLSGLLALMPASMSIMAPHVNSFRRIRKSLTEPMFSSWGYNTRNAALRIPCSNDTSRRIEYRLAGVDVNPYLALATILCGILYGHEDDHQENFSLSPELPLFPLQAISSFRQNHYLTSQLDTRFSTLWVASRMMELAEFEQLVSPFEYDEYY